MNKSGIIFAILHTSEMTAEKIRGECPELEAEEVINTAKIFSMMDGQKAILLPSLNDIGYSFVALADENANRELAYQKEQDPFCGAYIGQREEFDTDYDSGDYSRDVTFCLNKKCVEVIPEKEWLALVEAEQEL